MNELEKARLAMMPYDAIAKNRGMTIREELTAQIQSKFQRTVEERLQDLVAAGHPKEKLSVRTVGGTFQIFVHEQLDSEFWVEVDGLKAQIQGRSLRSGAA